MLSLLNASAYAVCTYTKAETQNEHKQSGFFYFFIWENDVGLDEKLGFLIATLFWGETETSTS